MHRPHAARLQVGFQIQVEIGRVDADEHVGSVGGQQALLQLRADADDLAVVAQHLDIAAHRQLLAGPPGLEAVSGHLWAADAERLQIGPALTHATQQQARQQIARRFARHQGKTF